MADDGSNQGAIRPLPKFIFEVDFGTELTKVAFQEVSGMDVETPIIKYRKSNSKLFSDKKIPVILKKGIFVKDSSIWKWNEAINMNSIKRMTVIVRLLDETGKVAMQWTLKNAWPIKITCADLKSDGNEVAIDSIEIAYEQIIISNS